MAKQSKKKQGGSKGSSIKKGLQNKGKFAAELTPRTKPKTKPKTKK